MPAAWFAGKVPVGRGGVRQGREPDEPAGGQPIKTGTFSGILKRIAAHHGFGVDVLLEKLDRSPLRSQSAPGTVTPACQRAAYGVERLAGFCCPDAGLGGRSAFWEDLPVGVGAAGIEVGEARVAADAAGEFALAAEVAGGGGDLPWGGVEADVDGVIAEVVGIAFGTGAEGVVGGRSVDGEDFAHGFVEAGGHLVEDEEGAADVAPELAWGEGVVDVSAGLRVGVDDLADGDAPEVDAGEEFGVGGAGRAEHAAEGGRNLVGGGGAVAAGNGTDDFHDIPHGVRLSEAEEQTGSGREDQTEEPAPGKENERVGGFRHFGKRDKSTNRVARKRFFRGAGARIVPWTGALVTAVLQPVKF